MYTPEVQRLILLSEEGLLCRYCHDELHGLAETEPGVCQDCQLALSEINLPMYCSCCGEAEWSCACVCPQYDFPF